MDIVSVMELKEKLDRNPPARISNIKYTAMGNEITIKWDNPSDEDFAGVRIVRNYLRVPSSITDGNIVFMGATNSYTDMNFDSTRTVVYYRFFPYDKNYNYNKDSGQQIKIGKDVTSPAGTKIYGVRINEDSSSSNAVYRTDDASALSQEDYPFNEIRPCVLGRDGKVKYYLDKNNFTKKIDGTSASIYLSSSEDNVMIEFPKIYWKIYKEGTYVYVKYSKHKIDNTWTTLSHVRGTEERDYIYIGACLAGQDSSGKLRSANTSYSIKTEMTLQEARSSAQANGAGYEIMTYGAWLMLQILYIVRYADRDSQSLIGRGRTDMFESGESTSITVTKATYDLGMNFMGNGKQNMKWLGIQDFYGNGFQFIDGIVFQGDVTDRQLKGGSFKVGTNNFNNSGSGYTTVGEVELPYSSRYATVKNVFGTNLGGFCLFGRKVQAIAVIIAIR
ncbi:hypothetical protein [Clostridium sp. Marseille-Q7071]